MVKSLFPPPHLRMHFLININKIMYTIYIHSLDTEQVKLVGREKGRERGKEGLMGRKGKRC